MAMETQSPDFNSGKQQARKVSGYLQLRLASE